MHWILSSAGVPIGSFPSLEAAKAHASDASGYDMRWYVSRNDQGRRYLTGGHPEVIALDRRYVGALTIRSYLAAATIVESAIGGQAFLKRWYVDEGRDFLSLSS